jgi:hypothetical protein
MRNLVGAARLPLTPWMVAHRFGHAIFHIPSGNSKEQTDLYSVLNPLVDRINAQFSRFLEEYAEYKSYRGENLSRYQILASIATFASAKKYNLTQPGEFIIESFAQYLINGRVKYNYDQRDELPNEGMYKKYFLRTRNMEDFVNAVLAGEHGITEKPKSSDGKAYNHYNKLVKQIVAMRNEWTSNEKLYQGPAITEKFEASMNTIFEDIMKLCVGKAFVL